MYYPSALHLRGILCKDDGNHNISCFYFTVHQEINILHPLKNTQQYSYSASMLLMLITTESVDFLLKSWKYEN